MEFWSLQWNLIIVPFLRRMSLVISALVMSIVIKASVILFERNNNRLALIKAMRQGLRRPYLAIEEN